VGVGGAQKPTFNNATKSAVSNNVNFEILSTISPILGSASGAVLCHRLANIGIAEEEHLYLFAAVATVKRADRATKDISFWFELAVDFGGAAGSIAAAVVPSQLDTGTGLNCNWWDRNFASQWLPLVSMHDYVSFGTSYSHVTYVGMYINCLCATVVPMRLRNVSCICFESGQT